MNYPVMILPYVACFLALLAGAVFGLLFSFLARRGRMSPRTRDRLTVFSSVLVWLLLSVLLWLTDQNNPIFRKINGRGGLS